MDYSSNLNDLVRVRIMDINVKHFRIYCKMEIEIGEKHNENMFEHIKEMILVNWDY